jgi:hypothetical protein
MPSVGRARGGLRAGPAARGPLATPARAAATRRSGLLLDTPARSAALARGLLARELLALARGLLARELLALARGLLDTLARGLLRRGLWAAAAPDPVVADGRTELLSIDVFFYGAKRKSRWNR